MAMDELRKLVIALGAMSESQLRSMRGHVSGMSGSRQARELVLNLIDLYLAVGPDKNERAKAAAACLVALDEVDRGGGPGRIASPAAKSSGSGCAGVLLLGLTLFSVAVALACRLA